MGRTTDQVILGTMAESNAFWRQKHLQFAAERAAEAAKEIARQPTEAEDLERQYPGYREELNRQRALQGLPPL